MGISTIRSQFPENAKHFGIGSEISDFPGTREEIFDFHRFCAPGGRLSPADFT